MALKFSLIDSVDTSFQDHVLRTYLISVWLDLLVTATIAGVAWFLTDRPTNMPAAIVFLVVPLVSFLLCIILTMGLPKAGVTGQLWTVWLPAAIGMFCLALTGNAMATWSDAT